MTETTAWPRPTRYYSPPLEITNCDKVSAQKEDDGYVDFVELPMQKEEDVATMDVVPFEDRAVAGVATAVHWAVGTALPFVVEGGFYILGVTIKAVFVGLFRAFFVKRKKSKLDFPPAMGRTDRAAGFNNFNGNVTINGDVTINNYY